MLCLFSGCQFYRNVVVDENGKVLPWREHRDDPEAQARWNERHAQWQIEDAHRRYDAGLMVSLGKGGNKNRYTIGFNDGCLLYTSPSPRD